MNPVWDEQSHVMGIRIPLPVYGRVRNYVSNRWSESHWLRFFFRMRFTDLVTPDGRHIHDIKCMGCFE